MGLNEMIFKMAYNGQVLPKAGYSVFSQPIPKLICFSTAEDRICCRLEFRRPDN